MHSSDAHSVTITYKPLTISSENNSQDVKELVLNEKVHLRMWILFLARTDKYISPPYLKLVNIFPIFFSLMTLLLYIEHICSIAFQTITLLLLFLYLELFLVSYINKV